MNYNGMKSSKVRDIFIILLVTMMAFATGCTTTMSGKATTGQPLSSISSKRITGITTSNESGSTTVMIRGTDKLTYTSVKQPFPLGVVLYFPETAIESIDSSVSPENDVINSIETNGLTQNGRASKVNILLKRDVPYEVTQEESVLKVIFQKPSGESMQPVAAIEAVAGTPAETEKSTVAGDLQKGIGKTPEQSPAILSTAEEKKSITQHSKPAWVNRIDFSSEDAGKSSIIIGTTRPVEYDVQKITDRRLKLGLYHTNIPDYRQRQLITTRFESAVDRIIPVQSPGVEKNSIIFIELRESVPYFVEQTDNLIQIHFEASSIPPRPLEAAGLPPWKKIIAQAVIEHEIEMKEMEEPATAIHATGQYFEKRVYTGEKIALDFYETDIKNVFRILREISGKNFIIDDDVKGKVTMTLDKPVPWDQILDLVLKMNQLGLVYEGDIIRIATLKSIKRESELLMESITAEREAKEKIKDLAPLMTEYIAISYSNAREEVLPHIKNIVTKGRGSITVDERNNQIILTDTAEKIMQAKEIVKNIDKVTPQVIIEAKIVEISSSVSKDLGINWAMEGGIQPTDPKAGIGPQRGYDILGGTYGWNSAMNFPVSAAGGTIGFNFTRIAGTPFVLNAQLSALEVTGEVKIISAPKIVTLDNKKAMIKQGIEIGYFDEGEGEEDRDVEFKDVDLLLEVTPHVTPDSRISMTIFITKNDVDAIIEGIPSIATNEVETELLVNDGDTIVIGGIMKTNRTIGESGFPFLSKIPGLGWLFKLESDSQRDNELLIFITPTIVQLEQRNM